MKTKINLACLVAVFMLLSFSSKAYTFANNTTCDILIHYEMYDAGCNVCSFGSLAVPFGSSVILPNCPGAIGMCVVLVDIGGFTPIPNHKYVNITAAPACHPIGQYGQTGPSNGCNAATNYVITSNPSFWVIN